MSRRKSAALNAPATVEEAAALANNYAALDADIAAIEAERLTRIAQINADCDERIGRRKDQLNDAFKRLHAWWSSTGRASLPKGQRSAIFGGCKIGVRTPPPSLKLAKGETAASMIAKLKGLTFASGLTYLRVTVALNKEAIIADLKASGAIAVALGVLGFGLKADEEFFIDRMVKPDDAPKTVA